MQFQIFSDTYSIRFVKAMHLRSIMRNCIYIIIFFSQTFLSYAPYDVLVILGSLIKLIYFSRHEEHSQDDKRRRSMKKRLGISNGKRRSYPILGGRLHFVKFETGKLNECLEFISSKQLHLGGMHILSTRHCFLPRPSY